MMDLKEIIKWFIPCFHILQKSDLRLTFVCLFLLVNFCPTSLAKSNSDSILGAREYIYEKSGNILDRCATSSEIHDVGTLHEQRQRTFTSISEGRTFGLRFRKIIQSLIPLAFQLGAASTWAVVAAIVGVKTLLVTLMILKLLLLAGAAKIGAFFASKTEPVQSWHPPSKEVHVHIHNGAMGHHDEHEIAYPSWSRDGTPTGSETKSNGYEPYLVGPQTISTPYGNYVRMQPPTSGFSV